jgi:vacuolar-type H+-ATPase subunit H
MPLDNIETENFVPTGSSMSESYIILMNNALQERNKQFIIKIKDMEEQLNKIEDFKQKTNYHANNIKKLVKNFQDIDSTRKEITENKSKIIYSTRSNIKDYTKKAKSHLKFLQTLMALFTAFFYEFFDFNCTLSVVIMFIIISAFQESTISNLQIPLCHEEENACVELKNKIKKNTNYIYDLLEDL